MGAAPPAWRVQEHDELASTQDVAIAASQAGDPGRLAILAHRQSAGRGSRGRGWTAPPGNLNLSVLIRPDGQHPLGHWALVAGIALHDALSPYTRKLMLKWPNDLLLDGAKIGGILIDAAVSGNNAPGWYVLGIGANLAAAPDVPGRRTACLPPPAPSPRTIADSLLAALDRHAHATTTTGDWLARAHPKGTFLQIQTSTRRIEGDFEGITETGALKLVQHPQPISSGEVFLGLFPIPSAFSGGPACFS